LFTRAAWNPPCLRIVEDLSPPAPVRRRPRPSLPSLPTRSIPLRKTSTLLRRETELLQKSGPPIEQSQHWRSSSFPFGPQRHAQGPSSPPRWPHASLQEPSYTAFPHVSLCKCPCRSPNSEETFCPHISRGRGTLYVPSLLDNPDNAIPPRLPSGTGNMVKA